MFLCQYTQRTPLLLLMQSACTAAGEPKHIWLNSPTMLSCSQSDLVWLDSNLLAQTCRFKLFPIHTTNAS